MYIFIPFFFFIWGGLTVAYFHFGFQPEWLATILNTSSAGDSAANAFMLSTRGGLFIIGVGVFCLIWIVVRLWLGIDKFEEPQDSGSLREDIVEIFDALLTPIPSYEEEKETDPLSFGAFFDELSSTSSSEPEYLSDSDGKSVRITGRAVLMFFIWKTVMLSILQTVVISIRQMMMCIITMNEAGVFESSGAVRLPHWGLPVRPAKGI